MPNPTIPPETLEQRKARQYANLHALGDLGMELAHSAHALAKKQFANPAQARHKDAPDYAAIFTSLSRAVRQAISIEIRLDAPARTRPTFRVATRAPDPRRILLCRAFYDAIAGHPDRARRRREIDAHIDQVLAADPDLQSPIEDTVNTLCNALGIDLDVTKVPDALLNFGLPRPNLPPARAAPR